MERFVNRRIFLKLSGLSLALSVASPALARRLESPRRRLDDLPGRRDELRAQLDTPTLVVVFLRGGVDGLNVVVPTDDSEHAIYQSFRPTLQVPRTGPGSMQEAGTLLTDAFGAAVPWGLHPRMQALMPYWDSGALAIFPDVHYEAGSRSHFDSQQFYENGTPWNKFTPDGWANRHLRTSGSGDPLLRAVAFDNLTPFALQGSYPALTFSTLDGLSVSPNSGRNQRFLAAQEQAYPMLEGGAAAWDPQVAQAGRSLVDAIRWIESVSPLPDPSPAAAYPIPGPANGRHQYFGQRLRDLAKLIKSNAFRIELAEIDLHGWDTHNNQDVGANNLPNLVDVLASGLAAFMADIGDEHARKVAVVVLSEFGRTSRENGSLGTDHGSATVAMALGHPSVVQGRRVHHGQGGWHGLSDLRQNRDLKHSLDFRSVLSELVQRHLGNPSPDVFPDFTPEPIGFVA